MSAPIEIRSLQTDAELEQCLELQRATWGSDFHELVPPAILMICQKVGGVVAGAFDHGGALLGFVFGISGVREGRIAHWSHMLAVWDHARGRGLGKRLKEHQRRLLLEIGCEVVYWTYDPLVARNANLNIGRLGARPIEYVPDMYGADTGSDLHSGLGTDRFVVEWEIGAPRVEESLASPTHATPGPSEGALVFGRDQLERAEAVALEPIGAASEIWVEVPADIEQVKAGALDEARQWRAMTRAVLTRALDAGFAVVAFSVEGSDAAARCHYRLVHRRS